MIATVVRNMDSPPSALHRSRRFVGEASLPSTRTLLRPERDPTDRYTCCSVPATVLTDTNSRARVETAYEKLAGPLRYIAERQFSIPQDDAAELVQDVFLAFMRHHRTVADDAAWLTTSMRNACVTWWRRHRPSDPLPDTLLQASPDVAARVDLLRALDLITPRCRTVLWQRIIEDETAEQIARTCAGSNSAGYGRKLVYRCLKAFRDAYLTARRRA